ncbi:hypothetical protein SAMN05444745_10524 [Arthrobacter sp. OV608]|nr:hypothetical protein SAMN05444745_10524 [Arthrobacter sp. OV608]
MRDRPLPAHHVSANQTVTRDLSPLDALEFVRAILKAANVDRAHEAQPVMPLATISVPEDMSTSTRLHASGSKIHPLSLDFFARFVPFMARSPCPGSGGGGGGCRHGPTR